MKTLFETIQKLAEQSPRKIALIGDRYHEADDKIVNGKTNEQINYHQLWSEIIATKHALLALDVKCIALRAENSIDWAIIDLACLLAKIAIVPVPLFFTQQQVTHILSSANIDLLIGDWPEHHQQQQSMLSGMPVIVVTPQSIETSPLNETILNKTAKITFTSGSTGQPKGVCLSQLHLQQVTQTLADTLSESTLPSRHLVLLPLSTLLENITGLYVPLLLGVTCIIKEGKSVGLIGSSQFDIALFMQALKQFHPQSLVLTPALLMALIHISVINPELIKALRFVAVGGARVASALIKKARSQGIPVYEGYGLSECGSVVSLNSPHSNKIGSCGKVLAHCTVSIAPDGEILVSGANMLGYLGQPLTEKSIHTGDLGYLDKDDFLHINGRKKNVVITPFGRNISPEWIESEAQAYPELQKIVVLGDKNDQLTAFIANAEIPQSDLIKTVQIFNQQNPDYASIKKIIVCNDFVTYLNLLTSNGRPRRSEFNALLNKTEQLSKENQLSPQVTNELTIIDIRHADNNLQSCNLKEKAMNQPTPFFEKLKSATLDAQQTMYQAPIFAACQQKQISLPLYTSFLTQAYHHVKHTVPLLMACGGRLPEHYEWLRSALGEYIEEEKGHHEWILNDINACGENAELVRNNQQQGKVCEAIELMVAYLYHQIDRRNPMAFFGMVWVLEGTSVSVGGNIASLVQETLGLPDSAMSYLTSHSTLDQEHIKLFESLMNNITDIDDQQAVIEGANMVFNLYGQMLAQLTISAPIHNMQVA